MKKRIFCIISAILMLFTLCFPSFASSLDSSAPTERKQKNLDYTSIEYDFKYVINFDINDYPKNILSNFDFKLISLVDLGSSDNTLYAYVYNPKGIMVNNDSRNLIQINSNRFSNDSFGSKFKLELVDSFNESTYNAAGTNGVILKYKISLSDVTLQPVKERTYDVVELELVTNSLNNYPVEQKYTYYQSNSSLVYSVEKIDNILEFETKDHHSFYRVDSGWYNVYYDIQSVYFQIPKSVISEYGNLYQLSSLWEECELYPCLVTDSEFISDIYGSLVGNELEPGESEYSFNFSNQDIQSWWKNEAVPIHAFNAAWAQYGGDQLNKLGAVFYADKWYKGNEAVSSSTIMQYLDSKNWSDECFSNINKKNYDLNNPLIYTFGDDITYKESYVSSQWLWGKVYEEQDIDVEIFQEVNYSDFNLTPYEFSVKYKINEDDFDKIKAFHKSDYVTYIYHYTVTKSENFFDVCYYDGSNDLGDKFNGSLSNEDFAFRVTTIRNFDTISVTFKDKDFVTVFSIENCPSNYAPSIDAPTTSVPDDFKWLKDFLKLLIILLCVVIVITILFNILDIFKNRKTVIKIDKDSFNNRKKYKNQNRMFSYRGKKK